MMAGQLVARHPTNSMDEVPTVKIFEPVLIWVMGIRTMIEVMSQGILNSVLVASIPEYDQNKLLVNTNRTYTVFLFIEHEGSNGSTGVGTVAGLTMDTNGGLADTKMVDSAGDSMRRRRH